MPIIGPRMAIDLALPTGVDASRVLAFQMREGRTAEQVIAEAASIIGAVNDRLMARYSGLWFETQLDHAIYRVGKPGSRRRTPKKVEGVMAEAVRGDIIGHMLPLADYEDSTAWTELYLRDAWSSQIDADLREIADSWENEVDFTTVTRLLSKTENAVGSGYDVPFAIGTGVNVPYIPPNNGSYEFTSSHTHYLSVNGTISATNVATALENAITELRHHGHTGRLVALVSEADVAYYTAIPKKFVSFIPGGVTAVGGNSNAPTLVQTQELQGIPGEIFGLYLSDKGVVELRYHPRFPTGYLWMGKSYGVNNQRNPLALREHPTVGFGLFADPQVTKSLQPQLDKVLFKATYGVGVGNDRTNGVCVYIASGASQYENPTIS